MQIRELRLQTMLYIALNLSTNVVDFGGKHCATTLLEVWKCIQRSPENRDSQKRPGLCIPAHYLRRGMYFIGGACLIRKPVNPKKSCQGAVQVKVDLFLRILISSYPSSLALSVYCVKTGYKDPAARRRQRCPLMHIES